MLCKQTRQLKTIISTEGRDNSTNTPDKQCLTSDTKQRFSIFVFSEVARYMETKFGGFRLHRSQEVDTTTWMMNEQCHVIRLIKISHQVSDRNSDDMLRDKVNDLSTAMSISCYTCITPTSQRSLNVPASCNGIISIVNCCWQKIVSLDTASTNVETAVLVSIV